MGQVISYVWPFSSNTQETTASTQDDKSKLTKETPAQNETPKSNETQQPSQEAPKPAAPARPQIDRSIFIQKEKKDETIIRVPGQINGNQFLTDKLENCKVIVHDFCDSMTIDRCTNCEFVLSAVRGSIFARNCKNCKFAMVCGQFRCRECVDCDFFMHVKTGPVVESSENLRIGCAIVNYPELAEHMKKARLDPATNIWSDVHDFTPGEGHFTICSGAKLEMEILNNDAQLILPYTYAPDHEKARFTVKLAEEHWLEIVRLSQTELHLENTSRESDGNFSVEVCADSEDAAKELFAAFSPISVSSIQ